jgi:hypothetical protein
MNKTLQQVFTQLNEAQLMYAIGGSMMLKLRLFDVAPNDYDIMVSEADYHDVVAIFQRVAKQESKPSSFSFKTKYFTSFILEDITIDIMADFAYEHSEGIYHAIFDSESITDWILMEELQIPIMSLEEWYVLYNVMHRYEKIELIETYWKLNNLMNPQLLNRQLGQNLPFSIVCKIDKYLNNVK